MKRILITTLVLAMLFGCTNALAESAAVSTGKVSATGNGTVMVESDMATITLGVSEQSTDVMEAQATVNKKIAAVREALFEAGIDVTDISTNYIYIYAQYDYSGDYQRIVGYTATNELSVRTTDILHVGQVIDIAFAAGANQLNGVSFTRQDSVEAQEQALTMATQDAMRKAQTIAAAAGMQLGSITAIAEGYSYSYDSYMNVAYARDTGTGEGETQVQAALISVQATVTIEYELVK